MQMRGTARRKRRKTKRKQKKHCWTASAIRGVGNDAKASAYPPLKLTIRVGEGKGVGAWWREMGDGHEGG